MMKHVYSLIIIGCLIAILFSLKRNATSMPEKPVKDTGIQVGKTFEKTEYKEVKATSDTENKIRQSTTFRAYLDSDNRSRIGVSHKVRIGKKYYINSSLEGRENSSGKESVAVTGSITRYW